MADTTQPDAKKRKVDDEHGSLAPTSGLLIKRLSEKARLPTRGSALAAGYDLYRHAFHFDETVRANKCRSVRKIRLSLQRVRRSSTPRYLSRFLWALMVALLLVVG